MLAVRDYRLVGDGLLVSFDDNSVVSLIYRVENSRLVASGTLTSEQQQALTSFVDNNIDSTLSQIDARLRNFDGPFGVEANAFKSYTLITGNPDRYYLAGYYDFPIADANLTQAGTTVTHGTSNGSYAAHASIVAGGAGSVNAGQVGLRVTGTSITDAGVRTASDSETIVSDITTLSLNKYAESSKKWIGQITFELFTVNGSPTIFSLDFNFGFSKYDDFGNQDFIVSDLECIGRAGAGDTGFDILLFHHNNQNWTYSAAAFVPGGAIIAQLSTDHATERNLINNERFAYKRSGLSTSVNGEASEGVVLCAITTSGGSVEIMDAHIGVTNP